LFWGNATDDIEGCYKKDIFPRDTEGIGPDLQDDDKSSGHEAVSKSKERAFPGLQGKTCICETGREKCVACLKCSIVCPSQCIRIEYKETGDRRVLEKYEIEALRCVFCGYCAEVCPVCALVLTEVYEYADYTREQFLFDREGLLKNWDDFSSGLKTDTYFNKFWRHEGIDIKRMPVGKRLQKPIPIKLKEKVIL
jgi:NADH-quinone oxidoreductase subunit I